MEFPFELVHFCIVDPPPPLLVTSCGVKKYLCVAHEASGVFAVFVWCPLRLRAEIDVRDGTLGVL